MRVSWKWLSELVDLSQVGGPQGLGELLTQRGLEVEAIERQDQGLEKVVTAKLLARDKHPEADRLSLCKVDAGPGVSAEPLDIVCGAQNMKAGDMVALAQVGAELPNGMKIAAGKIRGQVSNGMLCSEQELKLKDTSEGIIILPAGTPAGKPLAEVLGRDDTILTLKLTANRGDCLSHFGLAREIAAALGQKPKRPEAKEVAFTGSPMKVDLMAGDSAPQFYGVSIEGVKVGPSPDWLVRRLEAVGSRSINNVVDATNLAMLELGHPMHAYDADLLKGGVIGVRVAKAGEELRLLDAQTVKLAGDELVIVTGGASAAGYPDGMPVGLAGVMGGGNSEVRDGTTRLFLECAEFAPGLVRKASTRHQRKTDAAHRFERGVDPKGLPLAISRLATLITTLAGGKVTGGVAAFMPSRDPKAGQPAARQITVDAEYFARFIGIDVTAAQAEQVLVGLDCQVAKSGLKWTVSPPSYRLDLSIPEDLAEEIARTVGYDKIHETIPPLSTAPQSIHTAILAARYQLLEKARDALAAEGLSETINYSFTQGKWLEQLGFKDSPKLLNALSEEFEHLVPSLLPGLIRNAQNNWRHHFGSEVPAIRLFELRPTFFAKGPLQAQGEFETGMDERWKLSFLMSGPRFAQTLKAEATSVDFYDVKAVVEGLLETLGSRGIRFLPLTSARPAARSDGAAAVGPPAAMNAVRNLLHPGQSVEILAGNQVAGYFGLLHPSLSKDLKARAPLYIGEFDWEALAKLSRPAREPRPFKAWGEYPPIERDFALVVKSDLPAEKITQAALKAGKPLAKVARIFDVYRGSQVGEGMTSVAVRVIFYDESRSLQESEAEAASVRIIESFRKELGAELRT